MITLQSKCLASPSLQLERIPPAETFVNELSAAFFNIHEPDREALKKHLRQSSGVTEQAIQQKPLNFWKDRQAAYTLRMPYCMDLPVLKIAKILLSPVQMPKEYPCSSKLVPRLNALVDKTWVDESGVSLSTDATAQAHSAALRIIESGRLSCKILYKQRCLMLRQMHKRVSAQCAYFAALQYVFGR